MIVSSGDNFFSWRSIHCEPISIRDTIKLRTSSTINSSAYKFDHRIPNFAQSNQLNDSHIANKKDRQFDYCDDDDANDGDDDDDDNDDDDHNDDDGEAGEPRRAVASWLVGSRCGSRSPASGNSGPPMHCSHCSHIVIYVSTLFTVFTYSNIRIHIVHVHTFLSPPFVWRPSLNIKERFTIWLDLACTG